MTQGVTPRALCIYEPFRGRNEGPSGRKAGPGVQLALRTVSTGGVRPLFLPRISDGDLVDASLGVEVSPVWYRGVFRHAVISRTLTHVGFVLLPSRMLKTVGPRI